MNMPQDSSDKSGKESTGKIFLGGKIGEVGVSDWRGFIALVTIFGFILCVAIAVWQDNMDMIQALGLIFEPLIMAIITFYFMSKAKEESKKR
jgi:hypothetical protein